MPQYSQFKGLTVVTLMEGTKIGTVDELFVDPDSKKVSWLRLRTGGLFGDHAWIPGEVVRGVGNDVLTVVSDNALRTGEAADEAEQLSESARKIVGKKVVTESGHVLGEARDYEIDPETLAITGVHIPADEQSGPNLLRKTGDDKMMMTPNVLTIGSDVIIVEDRAPEHTEAE